jgi:hypothetical protein
MKIPALLGGSEFWVKPVRRNENRKKATWKRGLVPWEKCAWALET